LLADVPLDKVGEFEKNFLEIIENKHKETVLEPLKNGQLTDEIESILRSEAAALSAGYKNN
jgi:F-type H+-transporting ATPase subunit alpha